MRRTHGLTAVLAIALTTPGLGAARPAHAQATVTIKGSDTMVVLGRRWAEEFMKKIFPTQIALKFPSRGGNVASLAQA
jgi:phosphate transport system substrate-binding protein